MLPVRPGDFRKNTTRATLPTPGCVIPATTDALTSTFAVSAELYPSSGTSRVLTALEADHEFLLEGDVFTQDLIETWIDYKRKNEVDPIRFRPHPHEFEMYFDI